MSQERDPLFEKALRRQLRTGELAGEARADACPDAELLAAYHERSLHSEEMSRLKEHLVECGRCQEILASVEETEHLPLATAQRIEPAAKNISEMKPRGAARRKWIAPAGAIAAGLLVWIAVREARTPELTPAPAARVPARQQSPPPAVADSRTPERDSDEARLKHENSPAMKPAPESGLVARTVPPTSGGAGNAVLGGVPAAPGRSGAGGPDNFAFQQNTLQQNTIQPYAGKVAGEIRKDREVAAEKPAPRPITGFAGDRATAPAPQPPAAPPSATASDEESHAMLDGKDIQADKLGKEKKQVMNERVAANRDAAARSFEDSVSLSMASIAASGPPAEIAAPDGKSIWKIAADGKVSHSTDGGKSWKLENTGVSATLLAGSAPSGTVCWLAGTFGTVLLTTDGGAHWTKLSAPVSVPIAEIHAKDAENAVITLQSSQVQFATYNGGQSWTMLTGKSDQPR
jgi:hypothetical protein